MVGRRGSWRRRRWWWWADRFLLFGSPHVGTYQICSARLDSARHGLATGSVGWWRLWEAASACQICRLPTYIHILCVLYVRMTLPPLHPRPRIHKSTADGGNANPKTDAPVPASDTVDQWIGIGEFDLFEKWGGYRAGWNHPPYALVHFAVPLVELFDRPSFLPKCTYMHSTCQSRLAICGRLLWLAAGRKS